MEQPKVVDALGKVACVGDFVVFAPPAKGAQEFIKGRIESIHEKTVKISYPSMAYDMNVKGWFMQDDGGDCLRKSGCFVIVGE